MRRKSEPQESAEQHIKNIRRATRKRYSTEEKIRIVLSGLRGEDSIAELCRREGIAQSLYYSWSKEFLEAGKRRLAGDTERQASSGEVKDLRRETPDYLALPNVACVGGSWIATRKMIAAEDWKAITTNARSAAEPYRK
jgi:transposase